MGSGDVLVEENSACIDALLHQFLLNFVELLTVVIGSDGSTAWKQLPVHRTIAYLPNAQHDLLLVEFRFWRQNSRIIAPQPLLSGFAVVVEDTLLIASEDPIQAAVLEAVQQCFAVRNTAIFLIFLQFVRYGRW